MPEMAISAITWTEGIGTWVARLTHLLDLARRAGEIAVSLGIA
jgi:hypothetical protein